MGLLSDYKHMGEPVGEPINFSDLTPEGIITLFGQSCYDELVKSKLQKNEIITTQETVLPEIKSDEIKPTENKPTENKPTENKPTENKPDEPEIQSPDTVIPTESKQNKLTLDQKQESLLCLVEIKLNELTVPLLKGKCKAVGLGCSGNKQELISSLIPDFLKLCTYIRNMKIQDLKKVAKTYEIKTLTSAKKEDIVLSILQHFTNNLILSVDNIKVAVESGDNDNASDSVQKPVKVLKSKQDSVNPSETDNHVKTIKPVEIAKTTRTVKTVKTVNLVESCKPEPRDKEPRDKEPRDKEPRDKEPRDKEPAGEKFQLDEEKKKDDKKKKQSIPKQVKIIVWNHYIGEDIIKHKCLCCKKVTISITNFDVGHVLSEKNGGTHEINNLRPICGACNHSMGTENMTEFVIKYGLYIG
jgi:5-methylcytosine-specific restriction endonuclease McrA